MSLFFGGELDVLPSGPNKASSHSVLFPVLGTGVSVATVALHPFDPGCVRTPLRFARFVFVHVAGTAQLRQFDFEVTPGEEANVIEVVHLFNISVICDIALNNSVTEFANIFNW